MDYGRELLEEVNKIRNTEEVRVVMKQRFRPKAEANDRHTSFCSDRYSSSHTVLVVLYSST